MGRDRGQTTMPCQHPEPMQKATVERDQMQEHTQSDNGGNLAGDRSPHLTAINAGKRSWSASGSGPLPKARKRMTTQLKLRFVHCLNFLAFGFRDFNV